VALIALAAHDPGGAGVLAAAAPGLRERGHGLLWLPAGPAAKLWREAGEYVPEMMNASAAIAAITREQPALLLTGTSFHDGYERALWAAARKLGIPSFAALDSWTNIEKRFRSADGSLEQPSALGVTDERTRAQIAAEEWCTARLFVIGQPHLALRVERLRRRRKNRPGGAAKRIIFFSEPIEEDYGPTARGFTQFDVATIVAEALAGSASVTLAFKPHPREAETRWRDWLARAPNARLASEDTETLLAAADGVLGVTTMVLVEAALTGIPTLSLQPDRPGAISPVIDEMVPVIARRAGVTEAIRAWVSDLDCPRQPTADRGLFDDGVRLAVAVEEILSGLA
jgi:hypothetical protein